MDLRSRRAMKVVMGKAINRIVAGKASGLMSVSVGTTTSASPNPIELWMIVPTVTATIIAAKGIKRPSEWSRFGSRYPSITR